MGKDETYADQFVLCRKQIADLGRSILYIFILAVQ